MTTLSEGAFVAIDLEIFHACGSKADGTVECWGEQGISENPARPRRRR
ncbi:MAG: hypothetical protein OXE50_03920 [Chloroflexi bacterium]|nr:hypothetical protein [Chloroflexota bacterium]